MRENLGQEVKVKLKQLTDKKYREFHMNLCKNSKEPILGVRVPVLRNYAKELVKMYSFDDLESIGEDCYEEIMLKGMFIGFQNKLEFELVKTKIKQYVPKINNWAVCDTFCAGLKITNKNKDEMFDFIKTFLDSEGEFELRFAIVMLLDYYIDDNYVDEVLKIMDNIKHDGYYVKMAIAWAISICLIRFYDKTINYLNNCNLDNFTYNKSLQKAIESFRITDKQKNQLRYLKKTCNE